PLDATNQVPITQEFLDAAGKFTSPLGKVVSQLLNLGYTSNDGDYYAWDPLAAVATVHKAVLGSKRLGITIVTTPPQQGTTQNDPASPNQVSVATSADAALFQSAFLGAFS